MPGNDSNSQQYTPPEGCIHYEIPGSATPGTYNVKFDDEGNVDTDGTLEFSITVGQENDEDFTKVLSWSSNFPIYAVIVKGGDAFNLYQYPSTARFDTDLVSPTNESDKPANISHVSVVICPDNFPTQTPSQTPAETTPPATTPPATTPPETIAPETTPPVTTAVTLPPTTTPSSTIVPPTTGPTSPPTGDNDLLEIPILFVFSGLLLGVFSFYTLRKNKINKS
jgi:hypothetical protein